MLLAGRRMTMVVTECQGKGKVTQLKVANIVYLHAHDAGRHIEPYGFKAPSPRLQRLAEEGVVFRQAFSTSPACSPSRASILTGLWPHVAGMMGLANFGFQMSDFSQHLAQSLSGIGIETVLAGFQHVTPDQSVIGYDKIVAPGDLTNHSLSSELIADAAVDYIHGSERPFFLDVGFVDTHRPYPKVSEDETRWVAPPPGIPDTFDTREDMAGHLVRLTNFDTAVGRVLDALDENQLRDSTLIIATTDHGLAWPGMKMTLRDSGIGVFLLMRGPGSWTGGRVIDELVSQIDIPPTIFDLLGEAIPEYFQGVSLVPLVEENAQVRTELFAETNYHIGYEPQRCVRTLRWKYTRRYLTREGSLFAHVDPGPTRTLMNTAGYLEQAYERESLNDLLLDPLEANNLIDSPRHEQIAAEMRERLRNWQESTYDPLLYGDIALPEGAQIFDAEKWGIESLD